MRKGLGWLAVLVVLCVAQSGCVMWCVQSWDSGTNGPSCRFKELQAIVPQGLLGKYKSVEVCPFTEQIPHLAPSKIVTAVAPELAAELEDSNLFLVVTTIPNQPPAGTLTIRGEIVYYDPGEVNERVLGMSGESELIGRVSLIDKESGDVVGMCDARGIVKTTFNEGNTVSLGLAKGVAKWIFLNHPSAEKEQE